jgi:Uma2 family endonuclease
MSLAAHISPPPLRNGDRLSRDEFMRRWEAMPDLKWAELIDGIVYMPSPISVIHSDYQGRITGWAWSYAAATPGCICLPGGTWLMAADSAPQPDVALAIRPEYGGQSKVEGKYAAGAPEFVVEVSHTTTVRDSGTKLRLYERTGVREYLIVRPAKQNLAWHVLVDGKYRDLEPDVEGLYRSHVFPGLWLNPDHLWNCDDRALAATIQQGASTPEHGDFVAELARRKR